MIRLIFFGALFGFVLSRIGATDYQTIADMFLLNDLHLAGVIGVTVLLLAPIFYVLNHKNIAGPTDCDIPFSPKPRTMGNPIGGLLFGAGWALTGACPGAALVQVGEGQLMGLFTLAGILIGTKLYLVQKERSPTAPQPNY